MSILDQPAVDFNYFLARKYALQGQEADATTSNAASTAIQARANAAVSATTAALNTTQNKLLPAESAARIAAQNAQSRLLGEQASVVRPEAEASIGNIRANTTQTGIQSRILIRGGLDEVTGPNAGKRTALDNVLGLGGYQGYKLPSYEPTQPIAPALPRIFRGF